MQASFKSYLPVFEMLIALTSIVAVMVLWLYRMRQQEIKAQPV
jgi:hypothetical protein